MRNPNRLALALGFVALAGCGGSGENGMNGDSSISGALPDAGPPPDLVATGADLSLENNACEAALAAEWKANPPTTGIGGKASADSYIKVIGKLMADFQVPGGAVAVTKNGRLVLAKGFGFADVDNLQPVEPDQLFRLASLSKQITAAAVLKLVAAGKLSLDEPAFAIVSDLKPLPGKTMNAALSKITIRNLLNHTGGWNRDFEKVGDPMFASFAISAALAKPGPANCEDTIRYMLDKQMTYAPGSTYCYSNFGYCVLGRVIERRSAAAYEDYVKSSWLGPAGATRARLGKTLLANRADDEVLYYGFPGEGLANSVFPTMPGMVPWEYGGWAIEAMDAHGGWIASPIDLLHSQLAVDGLPNPPDLLDMNAVAQMLANPGVPACTAQGGTTPTDPAYWYGFGWSVNKYGNHWHTGSLDGTSTEDVTASNGFSWAAFFNTRPQNGNFYNRLDQDLWTALQGATDWTAEDYFDLFPGFYTLHALWVDAAIIQPYLTGGGGVIPVRIEGRLNAGRVEFRVELATTSLHKSMKWDGAINQDCLSYRAKDAYLKSAGYSPVSVQSFNDASGHKVFQATWASYP